MYEQQELWIGTYTRKEGHVDGKAQGILKVDFNIENGEMSDASVAGPGILNPSFIAWSPDGKYCYAASETGSDVDTSGYIYAFIRSGDSLKVLNRQPSFAFAPCHVTVHPSGRLVLIANYVGGVAAAYPVAPDGSLQPASDVLRFSGNGPHSRQEASHPHSVNLSPDGSFAYIPDLGTDKIMIYQVDLAAGKLLPTDPAFVNAAPGAGPRHLAWHPVQPYAYVVNELDNSVTVYQQNTTNGQLTAIQSVTTLPEGFSGSNTTADVHVSPDGHWVLASNRGHNSLAVFAISADEGTLTPVGHPSTQGEVPRNFSFHPSGKYVLAANQNSSNVAVFRFDSEKGTLTLVHNHAVPTPVCLTWQ